MRARARTCHISDRTRPRRDVWGRILYIMVLYIVHVDFIYIYLPRYVMVMSNTVDIITNVTLTHETRVGNIIFNINYNLQFTL